MIKSVVLSALLWCCCMQYCEPQTANEPKEQIVCKMHLVKLDWLSAKWCVIYTLYVEKGEEESVSYDHFFDPYLNIRVKDKKTGEIVPNVAGGLLKPKNNPRLLTISAETPLTLLVPLNCNEVFKKDSLHKYEIEHLVYGKIKLK